MKRYFVCVNNLPENVDRQLIYKIFLQFGPIKKVYLHPEKTWCKVYYETLEEVEAAVNQLDRQPPYYLTLEIDSVFFDQEKKNLNNPSTSGSNTSTMSYEEEDDLYGYQGPSYYNIHGIAVSTLNGEDGRLYVALDEVKKVGFELFEEDNIPRAIDFNKQMLNELRVYLNIKARKYISKMECDIPKNAVDDIKNEVINEYMKNGIRNTKLPITNTPPMTRLKFNNDQSKSSQTSGSNAQRNNRNPPNRYKGPNQQDFQKPLRRPTSTPVRDDSHSSNLANMNKGRGKNWSKKDDNLVNKTSNSFVNNTKENINPKAQEKAIPKTITPDTNENVKNVLKRVELPLNEPVKVIVSFVESQEKCWAFKESDKENLEALLFETNLEARKRPSIKPVAGQICACSYLGTWYRALVREVTPKVKVHYLDFGNFNEDEIKDVRELPSNITSKLVLAVQLYIMTSKSKLEDNVQLNIIATKKNEDGSYQVEEVSNKPTAESKSLPSSLNALPAGKLSVEPKTKSKSQPAKTELMNGVTPKPSASRVQRGTRTDSPQSPTNKLAEQASNLTLKERLQKMKKESSNSQSNRKSVVDLFETGTSGTFEFIEQLDKDSCIAFVLTACFLGELESLEKIQGDKTSTLNGKVGDMVSVYKEDGETWVRGRIVSVKDGKYDVALLDYGKIISTGKICPLEQRFLDIPEFVCVCTGNSEFIDLFKKKNQADFTSNEKNKVQIGFNDVFYNVHCKRWDPSLKLKPTEDLDQSPVIVAPPGVKEVKDGERVLPVAINEGKLLVKTKETHVLTSKLNEQLASYSATPLVLTPVVNQLVLCPHETQPRLCRGIVTAVDNGYVDLDLIDLGFMDMAPISKLMNISESLAEHCATLIPITLKGFEKGQFSDEEIEFLEGYCKREEKLLTKKCSNNVFELFSLNGHDRLSLSEKMKGLSAATPSKGESRVMSKDVAGWQMKPGQTENLVCVNIEDEGRIIFIPHTGMDHFIELNEKIVECIKTNTEPYSPIAGELCLANYEGEWCRARAEKINKALEEYQVYYIDYGNAATIPSTDIRKMPKDFSKVPALAVAGQIKDINSNSNDKIVDIIKQEIILGNSYDVEATRNIKDNIYEINIPLLSAKIQETLDF